MTDKRDAHSKSIASDRVAGGVAGPMSAHSHVIEVLASPADGRQKA